MQHPTFKQVTHRPWPLPKRPWVIQQSWKNLLFVHWQIDPQWIRDRIPSALEVDLFDGKAWIGIVPFDMNAIKRRGLPSPSWIRDFPEINVRTYVRYKDKPGVWFFSLDVPKLLAVCLARALYHLPYHMAALHIEQKENCYTCIHRRNHHRFYAEYEPTETFETERNSFEWWATERYCLYSQSGSGGLYCTEIHHPRWGLEKCNLSIKENTLLDGMEAKAFSPKILFSKSINGIH